jgi:FMN-dependent NADH-azoreductase
MLLLHIVATPRDGDSHTLRISQAFLECLRAEQPDLRVETLNLFNADLPSVAGDNIEAKYSLMFGQSIDRRHAESWKDIERSIAQFKAADGYLVSVPMWNFSVPYVLKYYIDAIVQPGYLFTYDAQYQPVGLCQGKRMVCITSRGADYSPGTPLHASDLQEPYLRAIFGFVGIDMRFINVQPMDMGPELREAAVTAGVEEARVLAATTDW